MFITHKKGLKLDGTNPTYLYGYGGFNISLTPGVLARAGCLDGDGRRLRLPNLRGGGEYGKDWHEAGRKLHKQNVFDDFIAAAEWLIANKYTSTPKLAIGGGSNGGLLVGACHDAAPDLFGAALPAVGVMDMLRFHKFTIGWAWTSRLRLRRKRRRNSRRCYAYSPLHNLKPGDVLSADARHDRRSRRSRRAGAQLQVRRDAAGRAGRPAPVLIRIETKAGHGAGKPTDEDHRGARGHLRVPREGARHEARRPVERVMRRVLSLFFHAWERHLASVSKDRVVRPFERGLDWMPPGGRTAPPGEELKVVPVSTSPPSSPIPTPGSRRHPTTSTPSPGWRRDLARHVPHRAAHAAPRERPRRRAVFPRARWRARRPPPREC